MSDSRGPAEAGRAHAAALRMLGRRALFSAEVAQRLARKLCEKCKTPIHSAEDLLGMPDELLGRACRAAGCPACFDTGYAGRSPLVEWLEMNEALKQKIHDHATTAELEETAEATGTVPLRQAALDMVRTGGTSPEEIRRILGWESAAIG